MNSQLATFNFKNAREAGLSLFVVLISKDFMVVSCLICPSISLVFVLCCRAVWCLVSHLAGSRNLMDLTSPWIDGGGMRGSLQSVRVLLVQAKWTLYTNDVIVTNFRPKGITVFLWFSLMCVFLD